MNLLQLAEHGYLPDWLIRFGIRRLLGKGLKERRAPDVAAQVARTSQLAEQLRRGPLALAVEEANDQHYEVPAEFFQRTLGPRLKYSGCLFADNTTTLAEAEEAMLALTCERAEIADGMDVLELGCGWGSLTLWLAEQFPSCRITAVSNSHSQRRFIQARCQELELSNVQVITADIREFEIADRFDRVVSVEMFEHVRNHELLFKRISHWLHPDGKLFAHIFCHKDTPYLFDNEGSDDWMGRHFFTGGMMPSDDLFVHYQNDLTLQQRWRVGGLHYAATCDAWLSNLDRNYSQALAALAKVVGRAEAKITVQRWRMFFMACAELFRYHGGDEWYVAHYLFENRSAPSLAETDAAGKTQSGV